MPEPLVQILVCVNDRGENAPRPCCARRGSEDLYYRFKDRVRELGARDEVLVTRTGCLRHCSRGPTVVAWPGNLWHGGVTLEDVDDLIACVRRGERLERRRMPPGPWE